MIKVCDAIMGSGKTSAAISYMNSHRDQKFIFITPYLDEAKRIKDECPSLRFVEPSNKLCEYNFRKITHTAALVEEGRNIATTHQSFKGYTKEMLDSISRKEYTLIIDENVDVLDEFEYHPKDLKLAMDAGYVAFEGDQFKILRDDYEGQLFEEMFRMMKSRQLRILKSDKEETKLYWTLPPDLLTAFKDVYILTYLFEGQSLYYLLRLNHLPYIKIGVRKVGDHKFVFGKKDAYIPEYVYELKDKIHILDKKKLNDIGDNEYALSATWYKKGGQEFKTLKNNVYNYFYHIAKDADPSERMWGTYKAGFGKVKGKGYTKSFLPFNTKATNKYRNKKYLAYLANVYPNLNEKLFFQERGIKINDDLFALSILVQWIWRSAIRDGQEVYIYIPSRRMRTLLIDWINSLCKGGEPVNA